MPWPPPQAGPLPLPDRGGVPESKLYDYGVMGPPATPAIVAEASKALSMPMLAAPIAPDWHSIERHYQVPSWFNDVKFAIWMHWGLYSVPAHGSDRGDAAMARFLTDWVHRNVEPIDQYQPDFLWFDNGANLRVLDPLKLRVAAHYYNRAAQWGKQVTLSAGKSAMCSTLKISGRALPRTSVPATGWSAIPSAGKEWCDRAGRGCEYGWLAGSLETERTA